MKIQLILFISFIISNAGYSVQGFDLKRVVNSGLENSYELQAARGKLFASRLESKEKKGYFTPAISFSGYHDETEQLDPSWSYTVTKEFTVSLKQPIYNPSLTDNLKESVINGKIREIRFLEIKEKAVLDIMTAVFKICRIISQHEITKNSLNFIEKSVSVQKKLATASYGSKINVLEAEVELTRYQKEYRDITNKLVLEMLTLSQATQLELAVDQFPSLDDLSASRFSDKFAKDEDFWIEAADKYSTKLSMIRLQQQLAKLEKERSYDNFKPCIDLKFAHSITEDDSETVGMVRDNAITLSFSMSFTPLSSYYQLQRLDVDQTSLNMEEKKIKRELKDQINSLLETLEVTSSNLEMQEKWISKQEAMMDLYRKGFEKKYFSISKLLDISRKYNESLLEMAKTRIDFWEAQLQIFYLSGLLDRKAIAYFSQAIH